MALVNEEAWPPPATEKPIEPDSSRRIPSSKQILGAKLDVIQPVHDEINERCGINEKPGD